MLVERLVQIQSSALLPLMGVVVGLVLRRMQHKRVVLVVAVMMFLGKELEPLVIRHLPLPRKETTEAMLQRLQVLVVAEVVVLVQ